MLRGNRSAGNLIIAAGLVMLVFAASAAQRSSQQPAQHSPVQTPEAAAPVPNFAHDIAPILFRNCVPCHRPGESAPFSLLSYADAKKHAERIATVTSTREMPPWLPAAAYGDFAGEHRLTAEEIALIANWVKGGAPEGIASDTPPSPKFTEGWQLGPPDMIVEATRAFTIPAHGPDVFYNFIFTPGITTTKYIRAIEIRPGNSRLIHHANVIVDRARSARRQETEPGAGFPGMNVKIVRNVFDFDSHFLFWKPGSIPWVEQDGFSWRLDPGTDLVLNAHMMTMGMPEDVKPSIGLYFTDKPPKYAPILIQLDHDGALNIPPGDPDFVVTDKFTLPLDVDALAVYPHAHYLGHVLEGYAILPGGTRKELILIRHWDPKWQSVYHYREPVFLPKGTTLVMRWHFDNSAANPRNPHRPPQRVFSGNQSTDEMAHLSFQLLPREPGQLRALEEAFMARQLEKYPDDFQAHFWLGALKLSRIGSERCGRSVARSRVASTESAGRTQLAWRGAGSDRTFSRCDRTVPARVEDSARLHSGALQPCESAGENGSDSTRPCRISSKRRRRFRRTLRCTMISENCIFAWENLPKRWSNLIRRLPQIRPIRRR